MGLRTSYRILLHQSGETRISSTRARLALFVFPSRRARRHLSRGLGRQNRDCRQVRRAPVTLGIGFRGRDGGLRAIRLRRISANPPYDPTARLLQLDRLELRGQDHFQHFAVIGIIEHDVLDARRLDPRAALAHHDRALAVELGLDPALEHIDHLEIDVVVMALGNLFRTAWWDETDYVRAHHCVGGVGNAEVAVFRIAPQPALEIFFPMMADRELLGWPFARGSALARAPLRGRPLRPALRRQFEPCRFEPCRFELCRFELCRFELCPGHEYLPRQSSQSYVRT